MATPSPRVGRPNGLGGSGRRVVINNLRDYVRQVFAGAADTIYGGIAAALLRQEGALDDEVITRTMEDFLAGEEQSLSRQYAQTYGNLMAKAILNKERMRITRPGDSSTDGSLANAFRQARIKFDAKAREYAEAARARLNRAPEHTANFWRFIRAQSPGDTEREKSHNRKSGWKSDTNTVYVDGKGIRYDVPYGSRTYLRDSGLFAASFTEDVGAGSGRLRTKVSIRLTSEREGSRPVTIHIRNHVQAGAGGRIADGMMNVTGDTGNTRHSVRANATQIVRQALSGSTRESKAQASVRISAETRLGPAKDKVTAYHYRRHRRHAFLPYNNRTLAVEALAYAIEQQLVPRNRRGRG